MSDLDKKLDKAIIVGFLYGIQSDLLSNDEVQYRVAGFRHTKGYKEAICHAKEAFRDDGWMPLTQELKNMHTNMQQELTRLTMTPTPTYRVVGSKPTPGGEEIEEVMTGQDWYDKYNSVVDHVMLDAYGPVPRKGSQIPAPEWLTKSVALEAAKKASGIE